MKKQFEMNRLYIPNFMFKLNLSRTEMKVLGFIISYKSDKFYFSNKHLSMMFNVSEKSISTAVNKLKQKGFINIKYAIKAGGGKIRFITKSELLLNLLTSDSNGQLEYKDASSPTGSFIPDNDNKANNSKINNDNPPLKDTTIPPNDWGDVDNFSNQGDLLNQKSGWDCKTDTQRLLEFWVQIEYPSLYQSASNEQRREIFRRFSRDASSILKVAGSLEVAKEAMVACRNWLIEKKLEYNLTTIAKKIHRFLDEAFRKYSFPPETDLSLLEEYKKLYRELKGNDVPLLNLSNSIRQKMRDANKNANDILVEGIRRLKQQLNGESSDERVRFLIGDLANKISINKI
jgi:predicted transcriptional regulator